MSPYIKLSNIEFSYPGSSEETLNGISLDIDKQTIFGLLGPNGAGKSTLLSILSGLLPLQQGSVSIAGLSLTDQLFQIRQKLAIVPQEYAFYPALSARENLHFFASLLSLSKEKTQERVEFCLEACQLQQVGKKLAKQYSGGLKRRLNLAIGLLAEPELLFLDEPTVGIDAQSRYFILELIESFRDKGMTVIYTSHYFEEIEQLCDRVAVIDHGNVIGGILDKADISKGSLESRYLALTRPSLRD